MWASASRGVFAYTPAFAGIRCAYPRRDGQAEYSGKMYSFYVTVY